MGYFVTDPSLIALANAGLPPDEQVGGYYQMDEYEIARAAARPDLSQPTSVRTAKLGLSIGQFDSRAKRNPATAFWGVPRWRWDCQRLLRWWPHRTPERP